MNRTALFRRALAGTLVLAALGACGCSKKLAVNPAYTMPEGVFSPNARLIVYPDSAITVRAEHQVGRLYVYDSTFTVTNFGPGTILGMVVDGTPASGFELMRKEAGGGFAPAKDYALTPVAKWLETGSEAYVFHDQPTAGYMPPTYVARGLIGGTTTPSSVLTNEAALDIPSVEALTYTSPSETDEGDSLFTSTWDPFPGAVGYWVSVFRYRGDIRVGSEKLPYGVPAPFVTGKVHTFVLAYVPAPITAFKMGSNIGTVMHYEPMLTHNSYYVRVTAVDAAGRMIACTPGRSDTVLVGGESLIYLPAAEKIGVGFHPVRKP